jgi:hypothetical protein
MLSPDIFRREMENLADAFGESRQLKYEKRMQVYFEVLAPKLSDEQMIKTSQRLLDNGDRFPTIKTILAVAHEYKPEIMTGTATGNCWDCSGGLISAKKEGYSYAFRCSCESGNQLSKSIATWSHEREKHGYKRV